MLQNQTSIITEVNSIDKSLILESIIWKQKKIKKLICYKQIILSILMKKLNSIVYVNKYILLIQLKK